MCAALASDPERGGRWGGSDFLCLLPVLSLWTTEVWSVCYASAAPARDVCFVESGEADAPPATSSQGLMGSGIVGCLHQFPLGTRGKEREGRRPGLFPPLASRRLAGPMALTYTYMIIKCHIFHSKLRSSLLKGRSRASSLSCDAERRWELRLSPRWQQRPVELSQCSASHLLLAPLIAPPECTHAYTHTHTHTQRDLPTTHPTQSPS